MQRIRIVTAAELPECVCCGEPWCPLHAEHYADCDCVGPHSAEDAGYEVVELEGVLYGVRGVVA